MITISDLQFLSTSVVFCKLKFVNVRSDMISLPCVKVPGRIQHSGRRSGLSNIGLARRVTRIGASRRIVRLVVSLPAVDSLMTLTVAQLTQGSSPTSVTSAIGGGGRSEVGSRRRSGGGKVGSKHRRTSCRGCRCCGGW